MERLTIEEVIAHCERKCASLYKYKDSLPTVINNQSVNREYWEHYHVKEWLEELKQYRATGLTPDQLQEVDKLYREKCEELAKQSKAIYDVFIDLRLGIKDLEEFCISNEIDIEPEELTYYRALKVVERVEKEYRDAIGQQSKKV